MKNSELKRKLIFGLNQELLRLLKQFKIEQEMLLLNLEDAIKCAFEGEDEPRQRIANIDYKKALGLFIDCYCKILQKRKNIKEAQEWEARD